MSTASAFVFEPAAAQPGGGAAAAAGGSGGGRSPVMPQLRHSRGARWGAWAATLLLQGAIAAALLLSFGPRLVREPERVLQVSILPPAVKKPIPPPPPHPVLRVQQPVVVPVVPDLHLPQVQSVVPVASTPRAVSVRRPAPPRPVPAVRRTTATFEQQLLAAVQDEVNGHYPPAARLLHRQGQADVGFDYLDGQVSGLSLVQSSGSAVLDRAALATVRDAHYPPPPPQLLHQREHYDVWVRFRLDQG